MTDPLPPGLPATISWSLRIGISLAAALLALGSLLALAHGALGAISTPTPFSGGGFVLGSSWLDGTAFLFFGVVVLLLTPIARVLLSMVLFASIRDRTFTLITGVVLAILAASVVLGASA
ncbi:MAG: DUF1634 domain-containing protein [Thermoplasmata archaeon]|nr:DUF1634 domain-containing protein [Thermoplasmata archaeon]